MSEQAVREAFEKWQPAPMASTSALALSAFRAGYEAGLTAAPRDVPEDGMQCSGCEFAGTAEEIFAHEPECLASPMTQPQKREIAPSLPKRIGAAGENCGEKSE